MLPEAVVQRPCHLQVMPAVSLESQVTKLRTQCQLLKSLLKDPLLKPCMQVAVHVPVGVEASSQDL